MVDLHLANKDLNLQLLPDIIEKVKEYGVKKILNHKGGKRWVLWKTNIFNALTPNILPLAPPQLLSSNQTFIHEHNHRKAM
jgi:hypothetical protein